MTDKIILVGTKVSPTSYGEVCSAIRVDFDPEKENIMNVLKERYFENASWEDFLDAVRSYKWKLEIQQKECHKISIPIGYFNAMNHLAGYL